MKWYQGDCFGTIFILTHFLNFASHAFNTLEDGVNFHESLVIFVSHAFTTREDPINFHKDAIIFVSHAFMTPEDGVNFP